MPVPAAVRRSFLGSVVLLVAVLAESHAQDRTEVATAFKGHENAVYSVAVSPDRKLLATGSFDTTVGLWDTATGKLFKKFGGTGGHTKFVYAVAFSPDGSIVASGAADNTLKVWDVPLNAPIKTHPLPDPVRRLALSPDGLKLALALPDGKILLVNPADFKELAKFDGPPVASLAWSANSQSLIAGGEDGSLRTIDVAKNVTIPVGSHRGPVKRVLGQGGAIVSLGDDGTLRTWTMPAGPAKKDGVDPALALKSIDVGPAQDLAGIGGSLYTVDADKNLKAWTQALTPEKMSFPPADGPLRAVALAKNQLLLATGGDDKIVRVYSVTDGKLLGSALVGAPIRQLVFAPTSQILVANLADGKFVALGTPYVNGQPLAADFLKPVQTFVTPSPAIDIVALGDGASLLVASAEKGVAQWKIAGVTPPKSFQVGGAVLSIAFPPKDSTRVATGAQDGRIRFFDLAKNQPLKQIDAHVQKQGATSPIYSIAYSPDGSKIASASFDHSVKIWDATTYTLIREIAGFKDKDAPHGHFDEVYSVAFSPDGKLLATGSGGVEKVIKLWKVEDGSFIRDLVHPDWTREKGPAQSHPGWIHHLQFLKDGRLLAVGDAPRNEGYLSVWSTEDGRHLHSEPLPLGTVFGFAISGDEKLVAIGTGARGNRATGDLNQAYLLRVPGINR